MTRLKDFFLFSAGVDRTILEKTPTDENKYLGIGATVFFTGVLAFFSSSYALFTVFDSYFMAVVFGLVWGLMIFNLDRYIVMSMKSNGQWWRDFLVAAPRLLLAVLLALVISKPLELKIFEKEINAEVIIMEQEVFKNQEDGIKLRYDAQIAEQKNAIDILKKEISEKTKNRDDLSLIAIQEADGTGGSGQKNLGPIYRAKKADADAAQKELDDLLATALLQIQEKENNIKEMEAAISSEITSLERTRYDGMAARMEALSRLGEKSETIFLATIFITLLFIAIETSPIFVKLISQRSPYDYVLHEHEHVFQMANLDKTSELANAVKAKVKHDTEVTAHKVKSKIVEEKAVINKQLKERLEELGQHYDWDYKSL